MAHARHPQRALRPIGRRARLRARAARRPRRDRARPRASAAAATGSSPPSASDPTSRSSSASAAGLEQGQLHPRAVRLYNLLHRFCGRRSSRALAARRADPVRLAVGALAWAFHVALDRAIGYGLRTRDGFQRA